MGLPATLLRTYKSHKPSVFESATPTQCLIWQLSFLMKLLFEPEDLGSPFGFHLLIKLYRRIFSHPCFSVSLELSYMVAQSQGLKPAREASTLPLSTPQSPPLSYQTFENQCLKLPSRRLNFLIVIIRFLIPITLVKHGLCILSFLNFLPFYFDLVCDIGLLSLMNADKYIV